MPTYAIDKLVDWRTEDAAVSQGGGDVAMGKTAIRRHVSFLDFTKINRERTTDIVAADVINLCGIRTGQAVVGWSVRVHRAAGATCTADLRYGTVAMQNDMNLNAVGVPSAGMSGAFQTRYNTGTADVQVNLNLDHAPGNARVTICVFIADCEIDGSP